MVHHEYASYWMMKAAHKTYCNEESRISAINLCPARLMARILREVIGNMMLHGKYESSLMPTVDCKLPTS